MCSDGFLLFSWYLHAICYRYTLTGMEHTLQVALVAGCAVAIMRAYQGERIGPALLLCALLAPAVRYEDVIFTGAVCAALLLQRRAATAAGIFLLSLVPLVALGLFLHSHGPSFLPNSVLAKAGVLTARPHLFPRLLMLDHVVTVAAVGWISLVKEPDRWPLLLLVAAYTVLAWQRRRALGGQFLLIALAAVWLTVCFGPHGYFYRYDVCLRVFLLVLLLPLLLREPMPRYVLPWTLLTLTALVYVVAAARTPFACLETAEQQYQMHRFSHDFVRQNVAVNDVGWVAFASQNQYYVLDLVGLASNETLRAKNRDAAWLRGLIREHDIRIVMVYRVVFPDIPSEWTPLGVLHTKQPLLPGLIGNPTVSFYATRQEDSVAMRRQAEAFGRTVPKGDIWTTP